MFMLLTRFAAWFTPRYQHWRRVCAARSKAQQQEIDQLKARQVAAEKFNNARRHIG